MANAAPCAAADAQTPITQIDFARAGVGHASKWPPWPPPKDREPEAVRAAVAAGRTAIPANIHHAEPCSSRRRFHPGGRPSFARR